MKTPDMLRSEFRERLGVSIDTARQALEAAAADMRNAVLHCAPKPLLAFLWQQAGANGEATGRGTVTQGIAPESIVIAMEYLHAVLASHAPRSWGSNASDGAMQAVLRHAELVRHETMRYCLLVNKENREGVFAHHSGELHFQAQISWILSRAYRYSVLESEFLKFALAPHASALQQAYGVDAATIASSLQAAVTMLLQARETAASDANNISRTSGLPASLLDDLSCQPGENMEFFNPGPLCGTPLRTLPARMKPLIRLDDGHYACDPYFLRDSAYRAIERGLRRRLPGYAAEWTQRQTDATETGFAQIFEKQLAGANILRSVWYREAGTGKWCELDLLVRLDDVLFVIEAKGGGMPLHSPEQDFDKYSGKVRELIDKTYNQSRRFLEYANSRPEVLLFERSRENKKQAVASLRLSDYRLVFPIGLTIESFVPFSASSKHLPGIAPILGRFPFIAMAIDDLFALKRFLPTAGELAHYLEVRQRFAGQQELLLIDEADHLGLYVRYKRYDIAVDFMIAQGQERIILTGAATPVNAYFQLENWEQIPPPRYRFPTLFSRVLSALDSERRPGFLRTDAIIRDLSEVALERLEAAMETELPCLGAFPHRRILFAENVPCVLCMQRSDYVDVSGEHIQAAKEAANASDSGSCRLLIILVRDAQVCDAWGITIVANAGAN